MLTLAHPFGPDHVNTLPRYSGQISVAPSKRYFQDEAGQGFIVLGQNDAITWPGLSSLLDCTDPENTEAYIADLRAHGINVSRIMLEYAQDSANLLENPVGVFNPHVVEFWDNFIALAEKHGLYLLLTPYDTFWQAHNWETYPYSAGGGGSCPSMRGWLTDRATIDAQKRRWEFAIRRWGNSPNIFAWDIMNEVEFHYGCSPREIEAYITEMSGFVRNLELEVWGKSHMLTVSTAKAIPGGLLGETIYNHPALDFANTHLYVGDATRKPKNGIAAIAEIDRAVRQSTERIHATRPYFDSESGPIWGWIKEAKIDALLHHNMSWAHLAGGGAGSGMRWPYTDPHCLLPEMRDNLLGMARFAAHVDWTQFESKNVSERIELTARNVVKVGCADANTAILWLARDMRLVRPPMLDLVGVSVQANLNDGAYSVSIWNTLEGHSIATLQAEAQHGGISFTIPALPESLNSIAILIQRL
jgi:hypothetical protein